MDTKKLSKILEQHKLWLLSGFTKGICANLSGASLYSADLYGANLSRASLYGADLSGADLSCASLSRTNLSSADLSRANLSGANLSGANLSGANLSGADLSGANLSGADLSRTSLFGANLSRASLSDKQLKYVKQFTQIVPDEGELIVWKSGKDALIKLLIPKTAKRVNYIASRKCRAEFAKVLSIERNGKKITECKGKFNNSFIYRVGKIVKPDSFDPSSLNDCSHGIHFFLTKEEAQSWLESA